MAFHLLLQPLCWSQGGKVQERERETTAEAGATEGSAHGAEVPREQAGSPLLPQNKTTCTGRTKRFLFHRRTFQKAPFQSGAIFKIFNFFCLFLFLKHRSGIYFPEVEFTALKAHCITSWHGWKGLGVTNSNFHLISTKSELRLKIPADAMDLP